MRGGGVLKGWYHHLFRAMISFSEADKPSVVEKFEDLSAFLENLSHE